MKKILVSLSILIICGYGVYQVRKLYFFENEFPSELTNFTAIKNNPVFLGSNSNTWDKKIRERGYIIYENGIYKMWYSGYNKDTVETTFLGYATSSDGINWKRYSNKPIFREKWTEDMNVVKHKGTYYMYAEGKNDIAHLLISFDGIKWKEQGDLIFLTTKGDTIPGPYGTPSVWAEDDKWYLFYEREDSGIWLAESTDKLTWKNMQDDPVIALGPDKYDIAAIAADQIIKYKNRYYLYYHATDRLDWQNASSYVVWTSNLAMSRDLLHWTKYPNNPLVGGDHSSPILVFDHEKPSLYTMHPEVWRYISE